MIEQHVNLLVIQKELTSVDVFNTLLEPAS